MGRSYPAPHVETYRTAAIELCPVSAMAKRAQTVHDLGRAEENADAPANLPMEQT